MGFTTHIEWCHHTFNSWIGCAKVSPGCLNCFAAVDTPARVARSQGVELWGPNASRRIKADSGWSEPLRWDRAAAKAGERRRVFSVSQGDVFEDHPDLIAPRIRLFGLIRKTTNLDWLLLTKRPETWSKVMRDTIDAIPRKGKHVWLRWDLVDWLQSGRPAGRAAWPNIWLGVSVENQEWADKRIPMLLQIPAKVRFLSVEPMLGPVDLRGYFGPQSEGQWLNVVECGHPFSAYGVNWVIVGGESGPDARPCEIGWIRSIVGQCEASEVPCFVKQLGSGVYARNDEVSHWFDECAHLDLSATERFQGAVGHVLGLCDRKGGDPAEWPEDLQVRQFPKGE